MRRTSRERTFISGAHCRSTMRSPVLDDLAIALGNKLVAIPWFDDFYICGPEEFQSTLVAGLAARGARRIRVFFERFHSHGDPGQAPGWKSPKSCSRRSGLSMTWTGSRRNHAVAACGTGRTRAPQRLQATGACLSCQCQVLEGHVRYDSRPIGEIPAGGALLVLCETCHKQGRPCGVDSPSSGEHQHALRRSIPCRARLFACAPRRLRRAPMRAFAGRHSHSSTGPSTSSTSRLGEIRTAHCISSSTTVRNAVTASMRSGRAPTRLRISCIAWASPR